MAATCAVDRLRSCVVLKPANCAELRRASGAVLKLLKLLSVPVLIAVMSLASID
jgi:hypothetical protein